ncbi:cell division protein ZapA [Paracidovorax anthurii]|uniref:Cell division protein ZapA n=1 Tax=Paracidovorax anthurii TaxID=78229 RepID=A0A328YIV5_9BURK|nr:cell division protein ZapA [Paracidovorax anthurii]RAR73991.1 cell division protein ZapA [Paracidovorax anthurii]
MNQIEVQIMQQSYRLACPEGQQERLQQAVERVDAAMTRIRDAGKVRARERIAVLAALNLAFELADRGQAAPAEPEAAPAAVPGPADTAQEAPQPGHPATPSSSPVSGTDTLDSLLRRLDQALGEDGRLL